MLGEPRVGEKAAQVRKDKKTGRFEIVKLEERIAPSHQCHTNPQGREAACKHGR